MRTVEPSLVNLLFGQTRGRILSMLFSTPDGLFFVRQIARGVDVSVGTVQRELMTLSNAGLILRSETGNLVLYSANRSHPVYAEIRALLAKTTGVLHQLSVALKPLQQEIQFALVYGSFARGQENAQSDVDLMVVGSVTLDELLKRLEPVEAALNRPVNPTVYSLKELKAKLRANNHFLKAIQQGTNTFLIGDEHEFRQLR